MARRLSRRDEVSVEAALLMPAPVRRLLPLITALTIVWVGGLSLLVAGRMGPLGPDKPIDRYLIGLRHHLNTPATAIGLMDKPARFAALIVVCLALCVAIRSARTAVVLAGSLAVDLIAVEIIKELVRRRQPLPGYTFPSGHVTAAAVIATVAILACRRGGPAGRYLHHRVRVAITVLALLLVAVVALSMIIIQDHYFTDTIAAVPLGATATLLVAAGVDYGAGLWPSTRRHRDAPVGGRASGRAARSGPI